MAVGVTQCVDPGLFNSQLYPSSKVKTEKSNMFVYKINRIDFVQVSKIGSCDFASTLKMLVE